MEILNFEMFFTVKEKGKHYARSEKESGVFWVSIENYGFKPVPQEKSVILENKFEKTLKEYYD